MKISATKRKKEKIASKKISKYRKEGYGEKQSIAMGLEYAGLSNKSKKKKKKK
jgi:hypothetical protein